MIAMTLSTSGKRDPGCQSNSRHKPLEGGYKTQQSTLLSLGLMPLPTDALQPGRELVWTGTAAAADSRNRVEHQPVLHGGSRSSQACILST